MIRRSIALALLICLLARAEVDPCKRQPFRGRCPSVNGAPLMRSQFVLRYYLRDSECVSYPYGHCANDDNEPKLFRYKEECEDVCIKGARVETNEIAGNLLASNEEVEETTETPPVEATYATSKPLEKAKDTGYETPKTECQRQRDNNQGLVKGGFIPDCSENGEFKQLQCERDGSECFCVNAEGIEVDNSRIKGQKPDCEKIISASPQRTNECTGGSESGPCTNDIQRWFYDEETQACRQFTYSGCGGNGNNYPTEAACQRRCLPAKESGKCHLGLQPLKTSQGKIVNCAKTECPAGYKCSVIQQSSVCCPDTEKSLVGSLHSGVSAEACNLPKERGPCDRYELRFYYNQDLKECKYFFYGGCEGNDNNFARVEDCERTCGVTKITKDLPAPKFDKAPEKVVVTTTTTTTTTTQSTTRRPTTTTTATEPPTSTLGPPIVLPKEVEVRTFPPTTTPDLPTDRCLHPKDSGSCGGQFVRWLWNNENRKCESFAYTGCGGNGNNFATQEECLSICHIEVAKPEPLPDTTNVCESEIDTGECTGSFMRYAFDRTKGDCRQFQYGGCGGNGNNFATANECRKKCVPSKGTTTTSTTTLATPVASTSLNVELQVTPSLNICEHPIEIGECSGIFQRYAYDSESNECRSFEYGGCGGNGNNFATLAECRSACVRVRCPPAPQCDVTRCQFVNDNRGCPFCSCPPPPQHPPLSPKFTPQPNCPPLDVNLCVEPCIIFSNRQGCKECVCPVLPSQLPPQVLPPSLPRPRNGPLPAPPPPSPEISLPKTVRPAPPGPAHPPSPPSPPGVNIIATSGLPVVPAQRGLPNVTPSRVPPPPTSRPVGGELGEKCTQPVDPGPCKKFVERWHFNTERGDCEPFQYGGCAGNRNHFYSKRECEIHCARFSLESTSHSTVESTTTSTVPPTTASTAAFKPRPIPTRPSPVPLPEIFGPPQPPVQIQEDETCVLPPDAGNCTEFVPRYFYNSEKGICQEFSYGSCGGNANNFLDRCSCETRCGLPAATASLPERCKRPKEEGSGKGYFPTWYFNAKNLRCEQMVFRGTGGNDNRFESQRDCENICSIGIRTVPIPKHKPEKPEKKPLPPPVQKGSINVESYDGNQIQELPDSAPASAPNAPAPSAPVPETPAAPEYSGQPPAPAPAAPGTSNGVEGSSAYGAEPALPKMTPTGNEPKRIIAPSPQGGVNYQDGSPRQSGVVNVPKDKDIHLSNDFDLLPGIVPSEVEVPEEDSTEVPRIPLCPNGLDTMKYADGRPVMCLPGKNQCPENSVCYFNGMDFFCCPNAEDPYDTHIFGGYDGEEVKHGYKSVPTQINIQHIKRSRRQALPPTSFSIDSITRPLRFDDKPVTQISRAGSIDKLAHLRVNPCTQVVDKGTCNEAHLRYFYDIKVDGCRLFYYSGCEGNANNFATKAECEQRCKLGIVITTTTEAPKIAPGRCPGGRLPLGENAPVLCGDQTDSIGCPAGYYCRQGPPDVCCPEDPVDLQSILAASKSKEIRRKPFINAAGKFDGEHHHHHEHEHEHHHAHGVATEHAADGYDAAGLGEGAESIDAIAPAGGSEGHHEHAHAASSDGYNGASSGVSGSSQSEFNPINIPLPDNMCPDGSDALLGADGKAKSCGAGFDGHDLCPKGYYCSMDLERNSRLCCPMSIQGSNIPPPPVDAPYFGHRRANPGEVVERGSLPSDPKPPRLSTPKPRISSNVEHAGNNLGGESVAEFGNDGVSGVAGGSFSGNNQYPEDAAGNSELTQNAYPDSSNPIPVAPAVMPHNGQEEPYGHMFLKPVDRPNKLREVIFSSMKSPEGLVEDGHVRINSAEDPFDVEGSRPRIKTTVDRSICQLKPTEGRLCREDEPAPKTNLQYYYSIKDKKCKLFFHHGCGGNANRFDSKSACERFCIPQQ